MVKYNATRVYVSIMLYLLILINYNKRRLLHFNPFYLHVLVSGEKIEANYYLSIRENPGRKPEARMGLFIKHRFFEVGDDLCLATDGKQVFVYKNPGLLHLLDRKTWICATCLMKMWD